ncbi:dihydroneopterin aldolase [Varunaivibrio sulfuroxidans]|uniref:7,8-dihydroneopterin aldolase n=1 Tax=Varunaivibrio sulfuroxidans TaxID=1773489 RepID=A0A4R3J8M7_9PROT|nr:dihydroneopterin aldolase [Varunaivibrio sulfuroxidans]TCS60880.1 dihydroneopterin aldolase [Varunaivibrio sulfuroxidans]WES31710.1 dihydroneopterin aldolase [Varunaivibrio sulfuroxidans]
MTAPSVRLIAPAKIADARAGVRHVFVRDLVLDALIGVYDHERTRTQRVRINLDLAVLEGDAPLNDDLANVLCYEDLSNAVRALVAQGHINLVETLCAQITDLCLSYQRVRSARVRVEKLDVFADAASVGVEIERFNPEI